MANPGHPGPSMNNMEENIKRMQQFMDEQFHKFNTNNNTAQPGGFPPLGMQPMNIFPPTSGMTMPTPQFPAALPMVAQGGQINSLPQEQRDRIQTGQVVGPPAAQMDSNMDLSRCIQAKPDGKKELQLQFDMHGFKPDEINVVKDKNRVEVQAYHEEAEPNRVAYKTFQQQYHLPDNVRLAKMQSEIDPTGTLTVKSSVKPKQNVKFAPGQNLEQTKLLYSDSPEPSEHH